MTTAAGQPTFRSEAPVYLLTSDLAIASLEAKATFLQDGDTSALWTYMNKQITSILTTAAIAATSLFISAGTSHADFNPTAPSLEPTVKPVNEPQRTTSEASDTFTVQTKPPKRGGRGFLMICYTDPLTGVFGCHRA